MNKAKIHNDSLINNYLPADYLDSFSKEVVVNKTLHLILSLIWYSTDFLHG